MSHFLFCLSSSQVDFKNYIEDLGEIYDLYTVEAEEEVKVEEEKEHVEVRANGESKSPMDALLSMFSGK